MMIAQHSTLFAEPSDPGNVAKFIDRYWPPLPFLLIASCHPACRTKCKQRPTPGGVLLAHLQALLKPKGSWHVLNVTEATATNTPPCGSTSKSVGMMIKKQQWVGEGSPAPDSTRAAKCVALLLPLLTYVSHLWTYPKVSICQWNPI